MPTESSAVSPSGFEIRTYREADESAVVALLGAAFDGWPRDIAVADPGAFFRWKHLGSPFGRSLMLVAEQGSAIVGFAAWLPCRFSARGRSVDALRGVDLAVHPEQRGRGVAAALTQAGTDHASSRAAFTFSNPNDLSRRGVLRLGRREVGRFRILVRISRPLRTAVAFGSDSLATTLADADPGVTAETAADVLRDAERVTRLLSRARVPSDRFVTARDVDYLRWRYGAIEDYRAVRAERRGALEGMAIFRVRRRGPLSETHICELLVADDDRQLARELIRGTLAAARTDYATCHFPAHSMQRGAVARCGFVRSWRVERVLAHPFDVTGLPDPTELTSWALSLGDLELL